MTYLDIATMKNSWEWISENSDTHSVLVELYEVLEGRKGERVGEWRLRYSKMLRAASVPQNSWWWVRVRLDDLRAPGFEVQGHFTSGGRKHVATWDGGWNKPGVEFIDEEVREWLIGAEQIVRMT